MNSLLLEQLQIASRPGSPEVLVTIRNSSDREDVKETSRKHYIKSSFAFESVIGADLQVHSLDGYSEETVISLKPPYVKLRYSGENLIKSYPRAGRDATERKIISRSHEYFYWNGVRSELTPCDKKTISVVIEAMVKAYVEAHGALPPALKERKRYKNGQVQYGIETKQGTILIKLR